MKVALVLTGLLAASVLLVPAVPSYDPWMWLLWGREVAHGTLDTVDGPAFKPLPVAAGALLAPLGDVAPGAWVVLVRTAAVVALWLAFRLGRRLGGGAAGGVAATAALAACEGWLAFAAEGAEPALVVAGALGAAELWTGGRRRGALAVGVAVALLRVEAWPFLLVAALVHVRRERGDLLPLGLAGVGVLAAWFVPEWLGSGDPLRSGERARVPNPGQPALADVPALAALEAALGVAPLVALVALAATLARPPARRRVVPWAAAGGAWVLLVALMAQAGFSGEPRYALPGMALLAAAGAAAACSLSRHAGVRPLLAGAIVVAALVPALGPAADVREAQRARADDVAALDALIDRVGGRDAVLACGTAYVAAGRGPLLAHRLDVRKRAVEPDRPPRAPGIAFVAGDGRPATPPAFRPLATARRWEARGRCRS